MLLSRTVLVKDTRRLWWEGRTWSACMTPGSRSLRPRPLPPPFFFPAGFSCPSRRCFGLPHTDCGSASPLPFFLCRVPLSSLRSAPRARLVGRRAGGTRRRRGLLGLLASPPRGGVWRGPSVLWVLAAFLDAFLDSLSYCAWSFDPVCVGVAPHFRFSRRPLEAPGPPLAPAASSVGTRSLIPLPPLPIPAFVLSFSRLSFFGFPACHDDPVGPSRGRVIAVRSSSAHPLLPFPSVLSPCRLRRGRRRPRRSGRR